MIAAADLLLDERIFRLEICLQNKTAKDIERAARRQFAERFFPTLVRFFERFPSFTKVFSDCQI